MHFSLRQGLASRAFLHTQAARLAVLLAVLIVLPCLSWSQTNIVRTRVSGTVNWSASSTWMRMRTGTIGVTTGSNIVSGTGTSFLTELQAGDVIVLASTPGTIFTVSSVQTATELTLTANSGVTATSQAFGEQTNPTATDTVEIGNTAILAAVTVTLDQTPVSIAGLRIAATAYANTLTHTGTNTLNVAGNVDVQQPTAVVVNAWNINNGNVAVGGNVTLSSTTTTAGRIRRIVVNGTGVLDINGDLVYQAITGASATLAVVDMGTGTPTLRIGGSLTYSGAMLGTLTSGTGATAIFDGTGTQTIWGGSSIGYRNLTINKTSGVANLAATLDVQGAFNVQQGSFSMNALGLTVRGNFLNQGSVTVPASTLTVYGNWTNTGTYSSANGSISFRGATNQLVSSTTPTLDIYNLTFNRTAGALAFSGITKINARAFSSALGATGTVTMPDSVDLSNSFTLTSGTYTSGSVLMIPSNAALNAPFVHNNGTVIFDGSGNQTISATVLPTFFNLRVLKSSSSYTLTINNNINIAGTLDIANATSNVAAIAAGGSETMQLSAGALTGLGVIRCYRTAAPADFNSQFKFSSLNLTGLRVEYLGVGAQTVNALAYSRLTIGGTLGTKTADGPLTTLTALTIADKIALDMGTHVLGGTLTTISNSGRLRTQNTTTSALPTGKNWGDSVEYYAAAGGHNVISGTYATLVLPGAGTQTAWGGILTVNTRLILPTATVLNMGTNTLAGTLTAMSGSGVIRTQSTATTPITSGKIWPYAIEYTAAAGGQFIPAGTYRTLACSHTSGTTTASGSFTVDTLFSSTGAGATFSTASYTVTVKGNFNVAGTMAGTGILLFNGTVAQTLTAGGTLYHLTINKSGTDLNLGGNITVAGTVTFTLGRIVTGSYHLHSTSGTFTGAAQTTGWVNGSVRRNFSVGAPSGVFPVGGPLYFAPVTVALSSVTAPGTITASSPGGQHPNILTSNILTTHNIARYWTLSSAGGLAFANYAATLNWNIAEVYAGQQPASMSVARYAGSTWSTQTVGGTPTTTQIQAVGVTSMGDFIVGDSCSVSATIAYPGGPFPASGTASVTHTGDGSGTYSGTTGLSIDGATGQINLAASTPGFHTVSYTIPSALGCGTYVTTTPVHVYNTCTWTGASGTAWTTASNWSPAVVPSAFSRVMVPTGLSNYAVVSSGVAVGYEFVLSGTASITVSTGATLKIGGPISGSGKITATAGTIEYAGSFAQSIAANRFTSNEVMHLVCNNAAGMTLGGTLGLTGSLKIVDGALTTGGFLTLKSNATRTAFIDGSGVGTVSGAVTMQRYLPSRYGYKYISSPFSDATVAQLSQECDLNASFPRNYRYDEDVATSGWVAHITTTLPLNVGEGYAANVGAAGGAYTMEMTGAVNNGPISFPVLTHHNQTYTQGFNLVGNPYPSPIDWDAVGGWNRTNVDNAVYYFNASTNNQYTGTYSSYVNGQSSDANATGVIAAMQGFFVHVSNGTFPVTGTLEVNNAARTTTPQAYFHKKTGSETVRVRLSARFEESEVTDGAVLYYTDGATPAFDRTHDALKMLNTDPSVPNLYWRGPASEKMSIYATAEPTGYRGAAAIYALAAECAQGGWLRIAAEELKDLPAGVTAYLADAQEGTTIKLSPGTFHRTYLDAGTHNDRFYFLLSEDASITLPWKVDEAPVYAAEGAVFVFGAATGTRVEIANTLGQIVHRETLTGSGFQRIAPHLSTGIYIVTTADATGHRKAKKIFIEPGS